MLASTYACNQLMKEYLAYLETLTDIHIDPRLRGVIGMSDLIQNTMMDVVKKPEQFDGLDTDARKTRLRRMLINNLKDAIDYIKAKKRDVRRTQSIDEAIERSSCRVKDMIAIEDTSPSEALMRVEEEMRLIEALSKLTARQREAIILQHFHHCKYTEIGEHMGCTVGAVARLLADALKKLRPFLPDLEIDHA